jgi:Cu+-exporting ATPase
MTAVSPVSAPAATSEPGPQAPSGGGREIELLVGGMTCAACAARVEKKLGKLDGVRAAVNYATGTALVTAPASMPLAALTEAVTQAGYTATARDERAAGEDGAAAERDAAWHFAYLRRRLIVALICYLPLTDLSLMLSLVPSLRFGGWQWVLAACAAPVALWCAWPFHRTALKNARHGTSSMDTLVSLGIIAACGWSAYAMFDLDNTRRGGRCGTS